MDKQYGLGDTLSVGVERVWRSKCVTRSFKIRNYRSRPETNIRDGFVCVCTDLRWTMNWGRRWKSWDPLCTMCNT